MNRSDKLTLVPGEDSGVEVDKVRFFEVRAGGGVRVTTVGW